MCCGLKRLNLIMDMIFIIEQTIVNIKLHNLIDTITRNIGVKLGDGKSTSYII